ncbi:sec-independent translocase, partial [Pasteurella multocida subsp. multocida str. Anand1_buffalo]
MFDIGFSELFLILVIGLLVLGPKRLPVAIRTVMGWVATIRGLASNVQNELKQELKLQELQESIKKAEELNFQQLSPELSKTVEELKASAEKMRTALEQKAAATNTTL